MNDEIAVNLTTIESWEPERQEFFTHFAWQVGDDLFVGPLTKEDVFKDCSYFWNHSCDPNCWFATDNTITARRFIKKGEELTFDYGTTDSHFVSVSQCLCGTKLCRGRTDPNDWKRPELQERYGNHFMYYLLQKIDRQRRGVHNRKQK